MRRHLDERSLENEYAASRRGLARPLSFDRPSDQDPQQSTRSQLGAWAYTCAHDEHIAEWHSDAFARRT